MADITGVSEEWENKADLRAFVLEHRLLTVRPVGSKWCEPNRPNCTANSEALKPLLRRMRVDALKLPNLDDLKKEVADVFLRLSMKLPEKEVYTTAVELKKLCSFVKRRANRLEVTKVSWMGQQDPLDMTNYKDPQSPFGREVSRIKHNVMRALDEYASFAAEWNAD
eukprot:Skav228325  [mRNA]  locus=scaffold4117:257355:261343:+ [translate_table: standard]